RAAAAARRCVLGGRVRRRGGDERQEVGFRSRAAAAAVGLRGVGGVEQARAAADSGLREREVHAVGGGEVSGDRGGDGADLLVPGHGQERGGAAVGLHAHQVDALFGVGELAVAVRGDGAAGVLVRVDQRGQGGRGLQTLVQVQAQFVQEG